VFYDADKYVFYFEIEQTTLGGRVPLVRYQGPLIQWARWARAQGPLAPGGPERLTCNFLLRHHKQNGANSKGGMEYRINSDPHSAFQIGERVLPFYAIRLRSSSSSYLFSENNTKYIINQISINAIGRLPEKREAKYDETSHKWATVGYDAIRREQKVSVSIFRRSRVVLESQL